MWLFCNPCCPPDSSVHGISQAKILEWVAICFSKGSSWPRDQTCISYTGKWIIYHWATRKAPNIYHTIIYLLYYIIYNICKGLNKQWNCCYCSVAQLSLTLCDPMDCSTPGLPVHPHLPEFSQVHLHCIGDAV